VASDGWRCRGACPGAPAAAVPDAPALGPVGRWRPPGSPPSPSPSPPPSDRFLDDFLITLRRKLPSTSAAGLSTVASSLPAISGGVRLNEIVADAQARYDALVAAEAAAAEAPGAEQGYDGSGQDHAAPEPAAVTA
jgi:hypothetical protein